MCVCVSMLRLERRITSSLQSRKECPWLCMWLFRPTSLWRVYDKQKTDLCV